MLANHFEYGKLWQPMATAFEALELPPSAPRLFSAYQHRACPVQIAWRWQCVRSSAVDIKKAAMPKHLPLDVRLLAEGAEKKTRSDNQTERAPCATAGNEPPFWNGAKYYF